MFYVVTKYLLLYFVVESNYIVRTNAERPFISVSTAIKSGTVAISFLFIVEADHFKGGDIFTGPEGFIYISSRSNSFKINNSIPLNGGTQKYYRLGENFDAVLIITDPIRGEAYIIREKIILSYNLTNVAMNPVDFVYVIDSSVKDRTRSVISHKSPLITGTVRITYAGKTYLVSLSYIVSMPRRWFHSWYRDKVETLEASYC